MARAIVEKGSSRHAEALGAETAPAGKKRKARSHAHAMQYLRRGKLYRTASAPQRVDTRRRWRDMVIRYRTLITRRFDFAVWKTATGVNCNSFLISVERTFSSSVDRHRDAHQSAWSSRFG